MTPAQSDLSHCKVGACVFQGCDRAKKTDFHENLQRKPSWCQAFQRLKWDPPQQMEFTGLPRHVSRANNANRNIKNSNKVEQP